MAHKKAGGSTSNVHDSPGQRLGVKLFGGQKTKPGMIIVKQRGTKFHPGDGVRRGNDDTLYAIRTGKVQFTRRKKAKFTGTLKWTNIVNVV